MKGVDFKTAQLIYKKNLEIDRKALAVIHDLGLKQGQQISEDELCRLVADTFGECSDVVLADLLGCIYFETSYTVNLKAKRDDADLLST